jgi:hypothetical protein
MILQVFVENNLISQAMPAHHAPTERAAKCEALNKAFMSHTLAEQPWDAIEGCCQHVIADVQQV